MHAELSREPVEQRRVPSKETSTLLVIVSNCFSKPRSAGEGRQGGGQLDVAETGPAGVPGSGIAKKKLISLLAESGCCGAISSASVTVLDGDASIRLLAAAASLHDVVALTWP